MTGIEKITGKIIDDAKSAAAEVTDKAKAEAKAITDAAEIFAKEDTEAFKDTLNGEKERIIAAADSSAALIMRNALLRERRRQIDITLSEILDDLKKLPDKEYFDMLKGLIAKSVMDGKGELILSEHDKKRMPASFSSELPKSITVSDETRKGLTDGFILKYGDIEQNGSFEAIISEKREQLEDIINKELF